MAGIRVNAQSPKITFSTTLLTLIQIVAPTNQRLVVNEASISFDGTSNTAAPGQVDVLRQTTAGTMSALTPKVVSKPVTETPTSTAQHTASAEPTAGDVLVSEFVHPQTGFLWQAPFGKEIIVPGGERLGMRVLFLAGADAVARFGYEE